MNYSKSFHEYTWQVADVNFAAVTATGFVLALSVFCMTPVLRLGEKHHSRLPSETQRFIEQLASRLNLTASQMIAVAPIIEEQGNRRKELLGKLQVEMDQLEQETLGRLAGVLNAGQMTQLYKMLEGRRSRGGEKQLPPPPQENVPPRTQEDGGQPRLNQ